MSVLSMLTRAIARLSRSTTGAQTIQAEDGEGYPTEDDVELYEQPGVSFRLPVGSEVLLLELGGDPSNLTALGTSGRGKRPTDALEEGEGGLYYAGVFKVFLKNDGTVRLGSPSATKRAATDADVEAELTKIKAELAKIQATLTTGTANLTSGVVTFSTPYTNAYTVVADVGASKVYVE